MKKPISFLFTLFFICNTIAQSVGIGTTNPATSAKLEVYSTTQGFLLPRMTEAERNAIQSPALGLVIFNTTTKCLNVYDASGWYGISGIISYPVGTLHCTAIPTTVVDVVNPATGKTWMDRNLGSSRAANSSTDADAYGDLYQWGRRADRHQCRISANTYTLSSTDQPIHNDFIAVTFGPFDWRSPQNENLWQGLNSVNSPCPSGYRLPTEAELIAERASWSSNNAAGAFTSPLKWPMAGKRNSSDGSLYEAGAEGNYWSSSVTSSGSRAMSFGSNSAGFNSYSRAFGFSVRCINNDAAMQASISSINCFIATPTGNLMEGVEANGVSSSVPYAGGTGNAHDGQTVSSTGVTGLKATLTAGSFANGDGVLVYSITGTPIGQGTATFTLNIGGLSCALSRTVSPPLGVLTTLNCGGATSTGTLIKDAPSSGVSSVPYTGGNGGTHSGQTVASTGVTGLTATLAAGSFTNAAGALEYTITGTPTGSGTASFALNIGGQTCSLTRTVNATGPAYPAGTVHCTPTPTAVEDVFNPATGRTWMDRNLGATRAATSSTDAAAYGDLYQWGRRADGHQCRNSNQTNLLSATDQPVNGNFIRTTDFPSDWRSPQNSNLWQGENGVNNPCPGGYRLPTIAELEAERASWSINNRTGAYASVLKLPVPGYRSYSDGSIIFAGADGFYWSSTVNSTGSRLLNISSGTNTLSTFARALGFSVRCIKD